MSDAALGYGLFWLGLCVAVGCWAISNALLSLGESIRGAFEDMDP